MSILQGKSALVTGGTSGIGRATAKALAKLGAHVVISGRDEVRGDKVVRDMSDDLDQLAAVAPAGRPASAEEIAEAIAFLATDRASFVHGAVLPVDGGRIAV